MDFLTTSTTQTLRVKFYTQGPSSIGVKRCIYFYCTPLHLLIGCPDKNALHTRPQLPKVQLGTAENSLLSLGYQTVHQNKKYSGPPGKLGVQITLITKMVANSHFITENSWLIVLNL